MKRISIILTVCLSILTNIVAQKIIPLYEGKASGSENWTWSEKVFTVPQVNERIVYNVSAPPLTVYLPDSLAANGTAVIVAPGGAFHILSYDNEGVEVAKWFNSKGIAAFVLKYRVAHMDTDNPLKDMMVKMSDFKKLDKENEPIIPLAMQDGLTAVKYVRSHAKEMHIDTHRIGFMGFSAGATLTMSVVYNATAENRPNFVAPIYAYANAIIGSTPPAVRTPIFIAVAGDDQLGFTTHSIDIYKKWFVAKQPAELHIYERGGHGFGMHKTGITTDAWVDQFGLWLKMQGYL